MDTEAEWISQHDIIHVDVMSDTRSVLNFLDMKRQFM